MELIWEYPIFGIAFSLSSIPTKTLPWIHMHGQAIHWTDKWILGIHSHAHLSGREGLLLWLLHRDNFHSRFPLNTGPAHILALAGSATCSCGNKGSVNFTVGFWLERCGIHKQVDANGVEVPSHFKAGGWSFSDHVFAIPKSHCVEIIRLTVQQCGCTCKER